MKKLPASRWVWLAVGLAATGAAFLVDDRVSAALNVAHDPVWHSIAWWCSKLGEGWVLAVAGIALAIGGLLVNRPRAAAKIFFVVLAAELAGLAAIIARALAGRTRPLAHVPPGFYGLWHDGHWIIGKYEFSSFPSGHSATAAGLVVALWLVHRGWGALAAVYALAVMWSRLALQCHHLSDVLASVVLATVLVRWMKPALLGTVAFQFDNLNRSLRKK